MRAYIEGQIEQLQTEVAMHIVMYQDAVRGVRDVVEKDINDERMAAATFNRPIDPTHTHIDWVEVQCREVKSRAERLQEVQRKLLVFLSINDELDKYEAPDGVAVDDAARELASNLRVAKMKASGLTMKKDLAERHFYEGKADAYTQALKILGYTDEQIDGMMKL